MRTRLALAATVVAAGSFVPSSHAQFFRKPASPPPAAPPRQVPTQQAAQAQRQAPAPAPTQGQQPAAPAPNNTAQVAKVDPKVLPSHSEIPANVIEDEDKLAVPLPDVPIEPYLLTKDVGPFMVMAYVFKGPDAPRKALALVLELRSQHNLPAYILLSKDFPGGSNIRGVPPQAELGQKVPAVGMPEAARTMDEAAVLVGNEKTVKDSTELLKKVKHLHLACFNGGTRRLPFLQGRELSRAIRTTNPFVPAELLFQQKPDVLLGQMNGGPRNILHCPGPFSLQVAEFSGRSSSILSANEVRFQNPLSLKKSPLETAADDAERMAEALSKDKEVQKLGVQAYVYHDRTSSRVLIGAFKGPTDPAAKQVHDQLIRIAADLSQRRVTDTMIVPASNLTDITPIKSSIQQAGGGMRAN